ncbi:unnamed protein product [Closterium sp. Naga37s-1]|nr:unnamed protein product [Closterium sp. Naga37s-1]
MTCVIVSKLGCNPHTGPPTANPFEQQPHWPRMRSADPLRPRNPDICQTFRLCASASPRRSQPEPVGLDGPHREQQWQTDVGQQATTPHREQQWQADVGQNATTCGRISVPIGTHPHNQLSARSFMRPPSFRSPVICIFSQNGATGGSTGNSSQVSLTPGKALPRPHHEQQWQTDMGQQAPTSPQRSSSAAVLLVA